MRREELADLVRPLLASEGIELVECSVSRTARSQTFRVSIDREDGITIESCERVSRWIAHRLEENPMLRGAYQLEVSSAGMNRPVWLPEHFRRFQGERARIELRETEGRTRVLHGVIGPLVEGHLLITLDGGETRELPFAEIARAHLQMDPWSKRPRVAEPAPGAGEETISGEGKNGRA